MAIEDLEGMTPLPLSNLISTCYKNKTRLKAGFTLIELLIVVAILGIIAGIGIPAYNGYIQSSKESVAENSLKSISLIESDFYTENNKYFTTYTGNQTRTINNGLFSGKKTLDENGDYYYFVRPYGSNGYRAHAYPKNNGSGLKRFCLDHNDSSC